MVISKKGLKKLGKSLRNEVQVSSSESLKVLKNYRRTFDPFLISAGNALNLKANESNIPFILSGRLKRVKSIVRKLVREPTMDLSRMSDIIGLRIIVENLNDQKSILKYIKNFLIDEQFRDYTTRDHGYRSYHMTGIWSEKPIEIQIRTLHQQLWAFESETLGEQVKEGGGDIHEKNYLTELSKMIKKFEEDGYFLKPQIEKSYFQKRRPIEYKLPWLINKFEITKKQFSHNTISIVLVHDTKTQEIVNIYKFLENDRDEALSEFDYLSNALDENRYNILLFNTHAREALQVTHPTFYI